MKLIVELRKFFSLRDQFKDRLLKREFDAELNLLNLNRLKFFSYLLLLMSAFLLYSDFFLGDFWETYQVSQFMVLDTTMLISAITIFLVTHIRAPKNADEVKTWHKAFFFGYLIYHHIWSVGVSIIESSTSNSVPTFLIGIFAIATIYMVRGTILLVLFVLSLVGLFAGLILNGLTIDQLASQYSSTIILISIAWLVSRALMITRQRSFLARKEIEAARDNLDQTVKERTSELEATNIRLREEIRERERYELGLKKEKKKAQEADRLKSIFLANMSHEIRTPLNGILGFGDLLSNPKLTVEKRDKYLDIIKNNGQQLLKIIDDVMDISMIESNQLKLNLIDFKLEHLLPEAKVFFENVARIQNKTGIKIINEGVVGQKSIEIHSDPTRVQQILYSLLNNAVKFTRSGSIRYGCKQEDDLVIVFVEDTGIGISAELSQTIFERFRQGEESSKRSYGGNGLGLSISKGLTELLGGLLWVDLSYNQGARFCFSLPIKQSNSVRWSTLTDKCCGILKERGLIIEPDNGNKLDVLKFFNKGKEPAINKMDLSSLVKLDKKYIPELLLFNLTNQNKKPLQLVEFILRNPDKKTISISKREAGFKNDLHEAGISLVLEDPINMCHLISFVTSNFD